MKITNNVVEFEPADVDQFDPDVQDALSNYNAGNSAMDTLSGVINSFVETARLVAVARKVDSLKPALVAAPETDREKVYDLVDEAKSVLGVNA